MMQVSYHDPSCLYQMHKVLRLFRFKSLCKVSLGYHELGILELKSHQSLSEPDQVVL